MDVHFSMPPDANHFCRSSSSSMMIAYQIITMSTSELLFELVPKLLTLSIDLCNSISILRIGSSLLHPNGHDRSSKSPAERPLSSNPSTKSSRQSRNKGILNPKILLETQGDRFCSIKPLIKITLLLFRNPFFITLLTHRPPPLIRLFQ